MKSLKISWKNLRYNPLSFFLNVLLIAFGTGILTILLLVSTQMTDKLRNNSKDIDLVVGAKGSPMQLILSSIYYIDFPTGNIPLKDAMLLAQNRMVKLAVPLALGDNYSGFRIVGTDSGFIKLYGLQLQQGKFQQKDFEITIGAEVARIKNLRIGDKIQGAHGLTTEGETHGEHSYVVSGILTKQNNVTDHLLLTTIPSVWKMHGLEERHDAEEKHDAEVGRHAEQEITALLIQYRSPMSVVLFPRLVNQSTNMQAASPATERVRLFSLFGLGIDTLQWFAVLIMLIAAVSVFVSIYNSLKERSYDLAIMRTIGASRTRLFAIIIFEGSILTLLGSLSGIFMAHLALEFIGSFQDAEQAKLTGLLFLLPELYILLAGITIGILAAIIPAIQVYKYNISQILSKS